MTSCLGLIGDECEALGNSDAVPYLDGEAPPILEGDAPEYLEAVRPGAWR